MLYVTRHKEVMYAWEVSQQLDLKPSWKSGMHITLLCMLSLIKCFIKVIFLRFCNELKFHILASKNGHNTFVL